jgi:hypothetical protein
MNDNEYQVFMGILYVALNPSGMASAVTAAAL